MTAKTSSAAGFKYYFLSVFARIWAVWGIISFITTFLLIFIPSMICYLIPQPKGQDIFIRISRLWMNVWLRMIGCPVSVKGWEHFATNQTYIITCNHNTLLDVPLSSPFIPGPNKTIAKKSFAKIPLFGWFYRKGSILVDRKDDNSRRRSYDAMKQTLAIGIHMCIYPEGTRNRTKDPLKQFYDGAFKLAVDTKTAVMPCLLFNTGKALPNNRFFYLLPIPLKMQFLTPVTPGSDSKALKEKVFQLMWDYYENNR
jgi:1-acyl-sn-glycerol-3-phosphate acyltransferase